MIMGYHNLPAKVGCDLFSNAFYLKPCEPNPPRVSYGLENQQIPIRSIKMGPQNRLWSKPWGVLEDAPGRCKNPPEFPFSP